MALTQRLAKRIFVSHSSKDNDFGVQLVHDLRQALGSDDAVWYDAAGGLGGGDAWWRTIMAELRARSIFLVILSPEALASPWVNNEIDLAWYQRTTLGNKTVIPILYRECAVRDDLEILYMISFLTPKTYEAAFGELMMAVQKAPDEPADVALTSVPITPLPQPASVAIKPGGQPAMPQASATVVQLMSIVEAFPARYLWLNQPELTVGRMPGNDILISDPAVSASHARLTAHGATWRVIRAPNAQSTYVNGRACEAREEVDLRPGDQITMGTSILRFELPERTSAAGPGETGQPPAPGHGPIPRLAVDCPDYPCHFTVPLRDPFLTIGRSPDNAITLPSPVVSLLHAELRRGNDGAYIITDKESLNGVTLRGQRILSARLRNGDVFIIGAQSQKRFVTLTYTES